MSYISRHQAKLVEQNCVDGLTAVLGVLDGIYITVKELADSEMSSFNFGEVEDLLLIIGTTTDLYERMHQYSKFG